MAEDQRDARTIRGIDWKSALPFTVIFRSFRVAVHPSKMILALIALVLIWCGGRLMDSFTPATSRAVPGELTLFDHAWSTPNAPAQFRLLCEDRRREVADLFNQRLAETGKPHGD